MVSLDKTNNAVVNNVQNTRLVQHFQDVLVFGTWLKPQQRHVGWAVANHQFHDGGLCPLRGKEQDHDFRDRSVIDGWTNGVTKNGTASVSRVHRYEAPSLAVQVVNRLVGWLFWLCTRATNMDGTC